MTVTRPAAGLPARPRRAPSHAGTSPATPGPAPADVDGGESPAQSPPPPAATGDLATRIPPVTASGTITARVAARAGLAVLENLAGGTGTARWQMLIYGMHLPGRWGTVEYVELDPGASCGEHLHAEREEIYYILGGQAVMHVNGEELTAAPGDLITCPIGTIHGITAPSSGPVTFFVTEVFPGTRPPRPYAKIGVRDLLRPALGYRAYSGDDLLVATVDLSQYLSGPWRLFTEIELPAGKILGPWVPPPGTAEVIYVTEGQAEIRPAAAARHSRRPGRGEPPGFTAVRGGAGLCAGLALGTWLQVANLSGTDPLRLISAQVAAS